MLSFSMSEVAVFVNDSITCDPRRRVSRHRVSLLPHETSTPMKPAALEAR